MGFESEPQPAGSVSAPPCAQCENNVSVVGTLRTDYVVYFRCEQCGAMWSVEHRLLEPFDSSGDSGSSSA